MEEGDIEDGRSWQL